MLLSRLIYDVIFRNLNRLKQFIIIFYTINLENKIKMQPINNFKHIFNNKNIMFIRRVCFCRAYV